MKDWDLFRIRNEFQHKMQQVKDESLRLTTPEESKKIMDEIGVHDGLPETCGCSKCKAAREK